jgi:hypothetical protein
MSIAWTIPAPSGGLCARRRSCLSYLRGRSDGYGSSPSRCGPSLSLNTDGQSRDIPASDAILLRVMWPSTPADHNASHNGIARVAFDHKDGLRSREFIISWLNHTPHATAVYASCSALPPPHATLASRRLARPYLGRTCTGWIAPALPGAFTYSITSFAAERKSGEIATPRERPVRKLTTKSNLAGSSIGRSPGLAPRRIRST